MISWHALVTLYLLTPSQPTQEGEERHATPAPVISLARLLSDSADHPEALLVVHF